LADARAEPARGFKFPLRLDASENRENSGSGYLSHRTRADRGTREAQQSFKLFEGYFGFFLFALLLEKFGGDGVERVGGCNGTSDPL
jgi:hypothetical protein